MCKTKDGLNVYFTRSGLAVKTSIKIPEGIKPEIKAAWASGVLNVDCEFKTGSWADPSMIQQAGGLDPERATEWCLTYEGEGIHHWGRLLFAVAANVESPPKHVFPWLYKKGNYVYHFVKRRGSTFICTNAHFRPDSGKPTEIAFPDFVPYDDIIKHTAV
jgi:hypothetical protein